MPGENLTRSEAQERARILHVHDYDVTLDVTGDERLFRSTTRVRFDAEAGASTFIDALAERVHRIELNGVELDPAEHADGARIALPGLAERNELLVEADMRYMNTGEGLHRFVDPADGEVYLYSQFEVPDARRVFAVFEQPDLKAEFVFHVIAPGRWQVLSNQPSPQPEPLDEARSRWDFPATPRISSYITAIVAGPYAAVRDSLRSIDGREIPLGVFCRASLAEHLDAEEILRTTRQGFEYFERNFRGHPYPFTKYDQIFVPEYNAGAMENAGCVTFTESYIFRAKVPDAVRERRAVTILHELAHMWFGNLVTMRWWDGLWLNESFAEFISTIACAEATEWSEAWTTFNAMDKNWAYRQDQLPSTHPVVAEIRDLEDVQVNFDGITYAKGASVLKQLFFWVGREPFFRGLGAYFDAHAWGNTELRNLLRELETTSGRDLGRWAELWLQTSGVNTLRPAIETDAAGRITAFAIEQSAHPDHPVLRPHRLAIGLYEQDAEGTMRRIERLELDVDGERTEVPELIGRRRAAIVLLNDDDLAYAKIRLDERSLRNAIEHIAAIGSPMARSLVLASVWDATRDGEAPARDFIRLALRAVAVETESTTRRTLLGQIATAALHYTDPAGREQSLQRTVDELWSLALAAEAGSDAQFAFVRSFAALARTPGQLDEVEALLEGERTLAGLEIDTDLGWELLDALVAGGRRGDAEIDARLAADNTADGQRFAARARAALPSPEDKLRAWERVVVADDAPNAIVRATAAGFGRANDEELLRPFVDRYFAALQGIWAERSFHIAEELVEGFYPSWLSTEQTLQAASAWLEAHPEAPAALRRLVLEGRAGTERSLRAQERDARA